jgi:hypothetical protein
MFPPEPPKVVPLKDQLAVLVERAKNKPAERAYEKAEKYILWQATKGFSSCTLPPINEHSVAHYVVSKFQEAGLKAAASHSSESNQWLVKVIW